MEKMKRFLCLLLTLCMVFGMIPGTVLAADTDMPFTDVTQDDWYYDAVQYVYENGMMGGTNSAKFSPGVPTTRGEFATILHHMEGSPVVTGEEFFDVAADQYYADAVAWASANGIVSGYGNGMFGPNDTITREQMVTILYRYVQYKNYTTTAALNLSAFADADQVSSFAVAGMTWAVGTGLISGTGDNRLTPAATATRAEVATIMMRFCTIVAPSLCQVAFDYNYNNLGTYETYAVESGATIDKPSSPHRSGYLFLGWYTDPYYGVKFDFDTPITEDITLYAKWTEILEVEVPVYTPEPEPPSTNEKSEAEKYYEDYSELIDIIDVEESDNLLNETEVKSVLADRGFIDYPITYKFSITGEYEGETEVSNGSTEQHPMYQTFYLSENGEGWMIYVINGEVFANPVSFNLVSDLGIQLLVSATEMLTSYDNESNKFYVTIPYASEIIVKTVDKIDAETLDKLTIEEICKLSGAAVPTTAIEDVDSSEPVMAFSHNAPYALASASTAAASEDNDPVIVVSLGDSYSSGEGITPFYGQGKSLSEKVQDENWLAHRSTLSWPGLLVIPGVTAEGKTLKDYMVDWSNGDTSNADIQWYFAASSGATTYHFDHTQKKPYDQGSGYKKTGDDAPTLPAQLDVFNNITGEVDYVTFTIGGNDVGFSDIIADAAINCAYLYFGETAALEDTFNDLWNNIENTIRNLVKAYAKVVNKAGEQAEIIVAGYPWLLDTSGRGAAFNQYESLLIDSNVYDFNILLRDIVCTLADRPNSLQSEYHDKIESIVASCEDIPYTPMKIHFVDVQSAFLTHEAYSVDENGEIDEWIHGIIIPAQSQDLKASLKDKAISSYSMHPNKDGAKAYARCVNAKIAEIEESKKPRKNISGIITIADTDTDMTNNVPLEGATIAIKNVSYSEEVAISNASGEYTLPNIPLGTYTITVSKDGYIPVVETIVVGEDDTEIIYNITIEAISSEYEGIGFASGQILDVGTGRPVSGLTLYIRAGLENTTGDIVSILYMNDSTTYSTTIGLPAGNYTIQVVDERTDITEEERYITTSFNIKILGNITIDNQNGYVSNGVTSEELRIVLTWGEYPSDLDSHLVGPTADGGKFHVYYGNDTHESEADLDVDDVSSYGPETITIHSFNEGIYTYAVHNYSNRHDSYSTSMANSGAQVKVYRGAELIATYNVPTNMDGTLWTVFTYNSETKQITTVNTMSYDSSSGGSLMSLALIDEDMTAPSEYDEVLTILTQDIFTNTKE